MKPLESNHILARIVEAKRNRLAKQKRLVPELVVRQLGRKPRARASFKAALEAPVPVRVIAEIKKASPSKGILSEALDVPGLARSYTESGAVAISVVTEQDFFHGDLGWIQVIREQTDLPILRKDFVFDEYQIHETYATGASAILLIVAMLTPDELQRFIEISRTVGLDALVEVHDEEELGEALAAGASIIGVNNRDLKTFDVTLETSVRLAAQIPDDVLFVAESGIRSRADIDRLRLCGADAFLIGEHLVSADNPAGALGALR